MKQSIVNWIPWPENGVEGLPKDKPMMLLGGDGETWGGMVIWDGLSLEWYAEESACMSIEYESFGIIDGLDTPTHYALASDLERDIEPTANFGKVSNGLALGPDEDRVRWYALMRAIWFTLDRRGSFLEWTDDQLRVAASHLRERAQVERERKEGGNGVA